MIEKRISALTAATALEAVDLFAVYVKAGSSYLVRSITKENLATAIGGGGGGSGTVTAVSVVAANGISGTVATSTTTPAITLTLGEITPTTVNGFDLSTLGTAAFTAAASYVTPAGTVTLTNKRITARVVAIAYAATVTPDGDTTDVLNIGTLTGNLTLANPTGTPTDGQRLILRFAQDATGGRTITRGNAFVFAATDTGYTAGDVPTGANESWEEVCLYHAGTSKWRIVGCSGVF